MRPVFHIGVCLVEKLCSVPFIVDSLSFEVWDIMPARYYWRSYFLMHGFALSFCVFPVMWTVFYACFAVYRLLAVGQLNSVNFNFNLYKMHGEYNIKK
jgi:hypothetical protein